MKISDPSGKPLAGLGQSSASVPSRKSGQSASAAGKTSVADRVQLSSLSAHLSAALGDSAEQVNKLSQLAAAVLTGGYQVDAGTVSESIIRHSLQFGAANYL